MEKLLNIHLIYCKVCRKYSKNNAHLTKFITKSPVRRDFERKFKNSFEKELAKHK
jgi:hypothetical protein